MRRFRSAPGQRSAAECGDVSSTANVRRDQKLSQDELLNQVSSVRMRMEHVLWPQSVDLTQEKTWAWCRLPLDPELG
jgi:hypothetical protein